MSEQNTCGKCGLPIHKSETGLRHFGFFTAHEENRCIELLRADLERMRGELEAARKEIKRLNQAIDDDLEDRRDTAAEAKWQERQGDEYGTY